MTEELRSGMHDTPELVLAECHGSYERLANGLPLSLLVKDLTGRRIFANQAYLSARGLTLSEIIGKRDCDLFPAEMAERYTRDDRHVIETGESLHSVEETVDPAGQQRWIERIKSPIRDAAGKIVGVQLLFWDVTDQHLMESRLKHEESMLRALLDHIPDSIYFKDLESRFLRISAALANKVGLPEEQTVLLKTDADIFTAEHAQGAREDELEIIRTGKPLLHRIEKETWRDRPDSWCLTTKIPFRDEEGNIIGTCGISRDITELKQSQDQLVQARDAADKANRAKSEFLANMSHEIRTPMNAIVGMSELLSQTQLSDEQRDYVDLVRESADSLLQLLNDILDFSKIEARRLELEAIPFSLRDVVGRTGQTLSLRAAQKGLELACRVAPEIPDRLIGDPGRLRQILINLIGNAIKFTDAGEVVVDVDLQPEQVRTAEGPAEGPAEDGLGLLFSVRDTGIGIAEDKQESILDAFSQADASTTRRFGGTGLGLSICKQLAALMGGDLWLESQPGKGANFHFSIRVQLPSSQGDDPRRRLTDLVGLRVLVVDDNSTNRRILEEVLQSWQLSPTLSSDAATALGEIRSAADHQTPFQLAILDCMMPGMDGFALAQRIRDDFDSESLKLIILSSAASENTVQRCQQFGISRYLTKPVVQSDLLETLLQVMEVESPSPTLAPSEFLPPCVPMRILVAEDGIANQHVVVGMLKAAGHQAVVASDGREAVARWDKEPFDAILMDMHMPVMDGLEATQVIRARESTTGGHIPIIAVTAAAMPEDARACLAAGMDDYLSKPIRPRQLQLVLCRYAPQPAEGAVQRCQAKSPPAAAAPRGQGTRTEDSLDEIATEFAEIMDLHEVAARVPGGIRGVCRLAEVFQKECRDLMQALRRAVDEGDQKGIARTSHTLKGSASLFSARHVCAISLRVEQSAKAGEMDEVRRRCEELEREVDALLGAVERLSALR